MVKDLIIDVSPFILIGLFVLLLVVKASIISSSLSKNYFSLLFSSLLFFNKVTVRNTFHEKLKEFYKRSNKINTVFYIAIGVILAMYLLMKTIK